jgi:hypothetical protein
MGMSEPEREHREFLETIRFLTATLESGEFGDRVIAEHLLRALEAAAEVLVEHVVDDMGRCTACRRRRDSVWPQRRTPCVVHDTFAYFFKGRRRFAGERRV